MMMPSDKFDLSDTSSGSKEREGERDRERDKNGSKSKTVAGQAKTKDVSHVPCKFFRLNQCTAGASCPFSHQLAEPGQQKDTCQWFLKGNCKFGHKCALAHILPGQPMSMDRKNKKAAQQAAAAATNTLSGATSPTPTSKRSTSSDKRKTGSVREESLRIGIARGLGRGSAPISISKATLSPSAPAPPLSDIDFPFGLPDDFTQPVQTSASKQSEHQKNIDASPLSTDILTLAEVVVTPPRVETTNQASTPPQQDTLLDDNILPLSRPSVSRGFSRQNGSAHFGFGPIGSPPRSSPAHTPTSQPIPHSIHQINELSPSASPRTSGLINTPMPASSPFSKNTFMSYSLDLDTSASTQIRAAGTRPPIITGAMSAGGATGWNVALGGTVEEDDLEEFLPSSLNELLTDEEKKRRLSRTGGQRPVLETHHRYSRSVPAVNLMDGVKGIWSDNNNNGDMQSNVALSPSFLGTSNVSTGFLPRRTTTNPRTFAEAPPTLTASHTHLNFSSSGSPLTTGFISPPLPGIFSHRTNTIAQPPSGPAPFDLLQQPRPIPATNQDVYGGGNPLSPTMRALQEHAPGQSLPQGLAAGLSRLHIRPSASITSATSPHLSTLSGSPGTRLMGGSSYASNTEYTGLTGLASVTSGGLGSLDSRPNNSIPTRRQWPSLSMKSPLTSAVIPNDDGLFEMDEDK